MRSERERDFVPTNINVGMMPRFFRELGDGVEELDRSGKILEHKSASDGVAALVPVRQRSERGFDLRGS